ncbi:nickel pincer cofactor biosynthesis protein LarC [Nitrospina watsonii]|uniref:Putative nickel insertion protein n=1 Tax=Nitrospina watsonii TaxID=1323948 RepID=A0ABM9HDS8_9BACT|nr:nickel pincer cofactor biosynthesis protein LarC [Nitrospina watsonii]CAI2718368.1 Putative nickel insertion protein [Nitrospina watsonii]
MKTLYFDCYAGISGDMILGALVDLGVDLKALQSGLKTLGLKGYEIKSRRVKRGHLAGIKVDVKVGHSHHHRGLSDIRTLIQNSKLPDAVKRTSIAVFERLGRAEARVHRIALDKVHFHEVGAVDSIIDIVGGVYALHLLGIDQVMASAVNTGEGTVACEHGVLPVPAPATLELLKGIPCFSSGVPKELTTPTGAAMIGHFAEKFQGMPLMTISKVGYGAGTHKLDDQPNLLRAVLGETLAKSSERVVLLETNIDDMNPEFYDHVMDKLFAAGALDVYFTPISMKKNRPAVKLSALCPPRRQDALTKILLTETSTYGVRSCEMDRAVLDRKIESIKTRWGTVKVKVGWLDGLPVHISPEYDDCRRLADKKNVPLKEVYEEATRRAEEVLRNG